jgi:hypothetical protein
MNLSETDRPDPLAQPGVVRIALSERATAALLEVGEAFAIVARGSYPTAPGRMVIYLLPVPRATAQAACNVILGTHKASRIKPRSRGQSDATTAQPEVAAKGTGARNLLMGKTEGAVP